MALDSFYNVFNFVYQEPGSVVKDAFGSKYTWQDKFTILGGILSKDSGDEGLKAGKIQVDQTHTLQIPIGHTINHTGRFVINNQIYSVVDTDDTISPISFSKHIDIALKKEGVKNG